MCDSVITLPASSSSSSPPLSFPFFSFSFFFSFPPPPPFSFHVFVLHLHLLLPPSFFCLFLFLLLPPSPYLNPATLAPSPTPRSSSPFQCPGADAPPPQDLRPTPPVGRARPRLRLPSRAGSPSFPPAKKRPLRQTVVYPFLPSGIYGHWAQLKKIESNERTKEKKKSIFGMRLGLREKFER